jgi:multidrug efflux system membrane fusion protein
VVKTNEVSLVTINQVNPIYVSFSVPEQYLQEIKRHMKDKKLVVEVFTSKNLKEPETGVLTFIENTVDTSTGTIRLKGTFANKERRLWPGQFIDVMLTLTVQYQAIIVPSEAVQTGQAGSYVFVVKDDSTVEVRTITVSRTIGGETVIDKGLRPDEQVVTDGHLRLVSGAKISIKNPKEGKVTPK